MDTLETIQKYELGSENEKALLGLSALAFEPLSTDDILELAPNTFPTTENIIQTQETLSPILEISANQITFTDGISSETILNHLNKEGLRDQWESIFLNFGERTLSQLQASNIKPSEANLYIVSNYHKHLTRAKTPKETFFKLLDPSWAKACEWWGQTKEFVKIAEQAIELAKKDPADLGGLVRAVLFKTSHSYIHPIPGKFLAAALRKKVISPEYAFSMIPDPEKFEYLFEDNLTELRLVLPEPYAGKVRELIKKHKVIIYEEDDRVRPQQEIETLSEEETEAEFKRIKQLEEKSDQHNEICDLFPLAHHKIIPDMIDFWIHNLTGWGYFPTGFVRHLPDELVDDMFGLGRFLSSESHPRVADNGARLLFELLDRLNGDQLIQLIEDYRFTSLYYYEVIDLLKFLNKDEVQIILNRIESSERISEIPEDLLQKMKSFTPSSHSSFYLDTFPIDPIKHPKIEDLDENIDVETELDQINKLEKDWEKFKKLTDLAFKLLDSQREPVLDQAIHMVEKFERDQNKFDFIKKTAGIFSEDQLTWALDLASNIDHPRVKTGYEGWSQSELLAILAHRFSGEKRREIELRAIESADQHTFYFTRGLIIGRIIQILPVSYYPTILNLAEQIDNEWGDYSTASQMQETIRTICAKWNQIYENDQEKYQALITILGITSQQPRWVLIAVLDDLLPIISNIGGEQALAEAFISAVQVTEWWP